MKTKTKPKAKPKPKYEELPEIPDYERPQLEKYEKPTFDKGDFKRELEVPQKMEKPVFKVEKAEQAEQPQKQAPAKVKKDELFLMVWICDECMCM